MRENILAGWGDDTNVARYLDTVRRSDHLEPEKALLIALLEDAVHSYRKFARTQGREGQEQFHEAEAWILAKDSDWIFSFNNVCEMLGLDPDYLRRRLGENRVGPASTERRQRVRPRHAA